MRILLAVDEHQPSEQAVEKLVQQFRQKETEVRVIHVLQPIAFSASPQMSPGYTPELQDFGRRAKDVLDHAAKSLTEAGFKTETLLRKGDIREEILKCAGEWKADLIMLGSHNHGGRLSILGSVADSVARQAPCSVELVRSSNGH